MGIRRAILKENLRRNLKGGNKMWQEFFMLGFINAMVAYVPGAAPGTGFIYTPNAPPVRIDSNSDFLWMKSLYGATNAQIRILFQDTRLGRQLSQTNIALRDIASNFCGTPFILPAPYYLLSAGSLFVINAADASGAANALRFVMHGAKLRSGIAPWEQSQGIWKTYRRKEPYIYNSGFRVLPANGTDSFSITIENDAPFLIQKMTGEHNGMVGAVLVDIQDTTSLETNWDNIPVPFETVFGTGQFPNIMYAYRLVGSGVTPATLIVNTQNLTGVAINYEVNFEGLKLFM
jgi:hypothetical protein